MVKLISITTVIFVAPKVKISQNHPIRGTGIATEPCSLSDDAHISTISKRIPVAAAVSMERGPNIVVK